MAPRTRFTEFRPILPVRDLRRALEHYTALGFETHAYAEGDEYGYADRDGIGLHLAADPAHDPLIDPDNNLIRFGSPMPDE